MVNLIWRNKIGTPLKAFIQSKYNTQEHCCKKLNLKKSTLSMAIRGYRKLSYRYQLKLIEAGFDKTIFYHYIDVPETDEIPDMSELQFIVGELKNIIRGKEVLLEAMEMLTTNLQRDLADAKRQITKLKQELSVHKGVNSRESTLTRII